VTETRPSAAQLLEATLIASAAARERRPFTSTLAIILREKVKVAAPRLPVQQSHIRPITAKKVYDDLSSADMEVWLERLKNLRRVEWGAASAEPAKLANWLYLGGAAGWSDEWLLAHGVTRVVNMAARDVRYTLSPPIEVLHIPAEDNETYDLFAHLPEVLNFVSGAAGSSVLIHCQVGMNRSAALALAALCIIDSLPFLSTFRHALNRRPGIVRNLHFQRQLLECVHREGLLLEESTVLSEVETYSQTLKSVFGLFAEGGLANLQRFRHILSSIGKDSEVDGHWEHMGMYTLTKRDEECVELWFRSDAKAAALYQDLCALASVETPEAREASTELGAV